MLIKYLSNIICNTVFDPKVLQKARRRKGAFTRNCGKLPYLTVIKLLLQNAKKTISAVLDDFFTALRKEAGLPIGDTAHCSHQAFSKARSGISHVIFKECFIRILDFLCNQQTNENQERLGGQWGIQPIAIDGSKIPLPNRKILRDKYGGMGPGASSPTAIASIAYDVLRGIVLDAQLDPLTTDERTLAIRHLDNIRDKQRVNLMYAMFIFDRGYASWSLIRHIADDIQAKFLFRLRTKFNNDIDALPVPKGDDIVDSVILLQGCYRVRILRFRLPGGIVETLLTNAFDLPKESFRQLYFLRWPVEGAYDIIKNKIGLNNFNGYADNSIQQEFWISMLLFNLASIVQQEADGIIRGGDPEITTNKHKYKINLNELIGCISRHMPEYLDSDSESEKHDIIRYILAFAMRNKVVNRKGSGDSNPRGTPRSVKHHYNRKQTH